MKNNKQAEEINNDFIYRPSSTETSSLRQTEIITNLIQWVPTLAAFDTSGMPSKINVAPIKHPFCIIMSQDCDLEQDFKNRNLDENSSKLIPNILVCPLMLAEEMVTNIEPAQIKEKKRATTTDWRMTRQNNNARYHFFQKIEENKDSKNQGMPELGCDFKRFFSMETSEIYRQLNNNAIRRSLMKPPYRDHFSIRFSNYLSRVALPRDHESEQ